MGSRLALGQHRRACGLHSDKLDVRLLLPQEPAGAGQGAAGARARHENVQDAAGLFPQLRAGGIVVGLGIGRILELAGDEAAGQLGRQLPGLFDGPCHALGALCQHQLGTVGLQEGPALLAHGLRHGEEDPRCV